MMENQQDVFVIPEKSKSGSGWERLSSTEFSERYKQQGKSYSINPVTYLGSLYKAIIKEIGSFIGSYVFIKTLLWDLPFRKPKLVVDSLAISSPEQKKYYQDKLNEYAPIIVFFNTLSKVIGNKQADRLIAHSILPFVLQMMHSKFSPIENLDSIEKYLQQTRNYLGNEWESDKGFSGDVYISKDKTELWFHMTRCAPMQMLKAYGLPFTATAFCMCDHITYHTLFPNLIFRRCHNLVTDKYCDLEFRIRKPFDPIIDEGNYVDCGRDCEVRELVRVWEEKAKVMFFGSKDTWETYADRFFSQE
jgi:hypothetical protein